MILARCGGLLAEDGLLALEIGHDQAAAVAGLCRQAGLAEPSIVKDLGGRSRVVMTRARASGTSWEPAKKALGKVG
jgi:methylase of polypeptide subunit release factors